MFTDKNESRMGLLCKWALDGRPFWYVHWYSRRKPRLAVVGQVSMLMLSADLNIGHTQAEWYASINYCRVHFALRWEKWVATAALAWLGRIYKQNATFFLHFFRPGVTSRRGIHYRDELAIPINFKFKLPSEFVSGNDGRPEAWSFILFYCSSQFILQPNATFPILLIHASRQIMSLFGVMHHCKQPIVLA